MVPERQMPASQRYLVTVADPHLHLVEVVLHLDAASLPAGEAVDVTMPAWCPGSYLIRDYARHVRELTATASDGSLLPATKLDKQTWRIQRGGAGSLRVRYRLYAHELTVRTNHVDPTHAFLHGPATFLYCEALRTQPIEVEVHAPAGWRMATGMPTDNLAPGHWRLAATNVDELFDMPIHVGFCEITSVPARVPVRLVQWGQREPGGIIEPGRLLADLGAIVDDHVARFGVAPFVDYTFVLMLAHDAYGGLEHRNSSINLFNPQLLASRKHYEGVLELLSHELFHAWNGKRIAPAALLQFDYTREAYTRCLWVMEGVTSHYDRWALRHSGRISAKAFLDKILDDWSRLVAIPGRALQSLEAASFDAWIKLYKPDESNLNTTVSYYLKGGLAMLCLDLEIRRRSDGARSLDDVLRLLWDGFGATGTPHPEDVEALFAEGAGLTLDGSFAAFIRGVDDPPLAAELAHVGLTLRAVRDPAQLTDGAEAVWIGATTAAGKVTGVIDGGPAQLAGLSPGDEIIAVDGYRTSSDADLREHVGMRRPGQAIELSLWRRHRLTRLEVVLASPPPTRFEIVAEAAADGDEARRFVAWLGEPYVAGATIATVTTTARWC